MDILVYVYISKQEHTSWGWEELASRHLNGPFHLGKTLRSCVVILFHYEPASKQ